MITLLRRCTGGDAVPAVLGAILSVAVVVVVVARHVAGPPATWMSVNVALALGPVVLATMLVAVTRRRVVWWVGIGLLLLCLPNTPYVLTDVVHGPAALAEARALGGSGLSLAIAFAALFTIGIVGYTYVMALMVADLRRQGRERLVWPVAAATNAACAVGVWLGRVYRLNSWDAAHPRLVASALARGTDVRSLTAIALVFVIVGGASLAVLRMTDRAAHRLGPVWRRAGGPSLSP